MKKHTSLLTALILGGSALAAWQYSQTWEEESHIKEPPKIIEVTRRSLRTQVSETGTIQPLQTLELKSQFSGEVAQLFVTSGQTVQEGQVIAIIKQESNQARQIAQLRAAIQEERLNVDTAQRELMRSQSLLQKGFIAEKELETANREYQRTLVRLELAERQLLLALGGNETLFRRYQESSNFTTRPEEFQVRAPSRGTVLEVLVQPGEMITSGTATIGGGTVLMRIADLSHMLVTAKINEVNIPRVEVGQSVEIRLDALPDRSFKGRVTQIAAQGVKADNIVTYDVTIAIENSDEKLRPMLTANVDIQTKELHDVLTVPLEVLRTEKGDDMVDVLTNGLPQPRKVRVAFRTNTQAVITQGLQEHDQVVIPTYDLESKDP